MIVKKIVVKPGAFHKIKSLPVGILSQVEIKLGTGTPGIVIAQWLQKECKLLVDENTMSLKKMLERYRKVELKKKVFNRIAGLQGGDATKTIMKRMNSMESLEEACRIQQARVYKILEKEHTTPFLLKDTHNALDLLHRMYANLFHMQIETGVIARVPRKVTGSVTNPDGTVTEFEWRDETEQLYAMLEVLQDAPTP